MANTITPAKTNIANSGRTLNLSTELEFNTGLPATTNRTPLIQLVTSGMAYKQMIDFVLDVPATTTDENIWEAPDEDNRARCVVIACEYGAGAIVINPDGTPIPFPISASPTVGSGYFIYTNPSGTGLTIGAVDTGPGINKINVSTEVESRFNVYIFI